MSVDGETKTEKSRRGKRGIAVSRTESGSETEESQKGRLCMGEEFSIMLYGTFEKLGIFNDF